MYSSIYELKFYFYHVYVWAQNHVFLFQSKMEMLNYINSKLWYNSSYLNITTFIMLATNGKLMDHCPAFVGACPVKGRLHLLILASSKHNWFHLNLQFVLTYFLESVNEAVSTHCWFNAIEFVLQVIFLFRECSAPLCEILPSFLQWVQ